MRYFNSLFPKTFSLTENQFAGKTYFYTIHPCTVAVDRILAEEAEVDVSVVAEVIDGAVGGAGEGGGIAPAGSIC